MRAIVLGFLGVSGLVWAGSVQAQTAPLPPASPPVVREPNAEPTSRSTRAESSATLTRADVQELIERIAELDTLIAGLGNLTLLGNAYRGVGLPDLIRDARAAARAIAS